MGRDTECLSVNAVGHPSFGMSRVRHFKGLLQGKCLSDPDHEMICRPDLLFLLSPTSNIALTIFRHTYLHPNHRNFLNRKKILGVLSQMGMFLPSYMGL